jgi:ribose transport system substrate-binding protein
MPNYQRGSIVVVLAAVSVTALVAGCSSGSSGSSGSSSSSAKATQTYAFVLPDAANPYYNLAECGAKAEATKLGVKITWAGPAGIDLQTIESDLSSVIATKPTAILLNPLSPTALVASAQQASSEGIPTFTWDATMVNDYVQNFRTDDVTAGKDAADYLGAALNGKGTVEVQGDISYNPVLADRVNGFKQELAAKYPAIKVLPTGFTQGNESLTASDTVALAKANPSLNAVYTASNSDLPGVVSGLRSLNPQRKVTIVSWDADPTTLADLKAGIIAALIVQNPKQEATLALQAAYNYVNNKVNKTQLTKENLLPVTVVTKATMNEPQDTTLWTC